MLAAPLAAQSAADADPGDAVLSRVVVTAAGFEQKLTQAPASISVIERSELERKGFANIAEALADVEGLDVLQGTGKTGGLNISIRGMPSSYTLILIDGRRQNNSGDVTPNGFAETATSFMPPLSAIERIEVIRGPMSTLYGSDAMGGVVNIITRSVAPVWGTSLGASSTWHQDSGYGASHGFNLYSSGPLRDDLLGLAVRGNAHHRDDSNLVFPDGSVVSRRGAAAVAGDNFDVGARLTLTPGNAHEFYLDASRGLQTYDNDDCQLGTLDGWSGNAVSGCTTASDQAAGYAEQLRFSRNQTVLAQSSRLDIGVWENSLTYKDTRTTGRTIPGRIGQAWTGFPGRIGGAPRTLESSDLIFETRLITDIGDAHMLTLGGQYLDAETEDGIAAEVFQRSSWTVFVEDEWSLTDTLALTLGGRWENHDAFGGHFSPRSYLVWNASDRWTVKGGVSNGYRVPTVNQLHDGINGATAQGATITIGSPHLSPETSRNVEAGIYYDTLAGFNANLTVFQTRFKDMISAGTPVPNCHAASQPGLPGCLDLGSGFSQDSFAQSVNIDEARSQGAELAARWQLLPAWTLAGNYTYTDTEQRSGVDAGAPFTHQARHIVNASLNWSASERIDLWLRGEYFGDRDRFTHLYENLSAANQAIVDGLGPLRAYSQFHLGGSFRLRPDLTLNANVYNLLDKDFLAGQTYPTADGSSAWGSHYTQIDRSTTGSIQEGRRLWLSLNYQF
ncbi:MAG: TonB-dependent receptor [Xanthomonadales bacterium]|nr:TonB-dependent receptor [Xanthomonadales bacterium]